MLEVKDLKVKFKVQSGFMDMLTGKNAKTINAVNGVNFSLEKGEMIALVGESGSGKTTTGRAILKLLEDSIVEGNIKFGNDIENNDIKAFRRKAQMIFQDPYQSLDPRNHVYKIVSEPLKVHGFKDKKDIDMRVEKALEDAGIKPASEFFYRYPHELSGGQRQRVAIAATMVLEPEFIVADEPVSMLDVSIRADILKLMVEMKQKKGISYLFITHDLSLAYAIADRIAIMYLGQIVEIGPAEEVINNPKHPYSKALLDAMPTMEPRKGKPRSLVKGEVPNPMNLPSGCTFNPRCPLAKDICRVEVPKELKLSNDHFVRCHLL
jgi:oligopeptide/dipeptide ABC transporter ATP-binding protein